MKTIVASPKGRAGTVALAGLIILVVLYSWALTGRFFDIMQSAYACAAAQVLRGLDLYTGTVALHTPLSILFLALLFSWFGVSLNVSTLATRLAGGLESVWIYLFARRLHMNAGWAFVAGLFTLIWGIELGVLGRTPSFYLCLGAFLATGALFFAGTFRSLPFTLLGGVLAGAAFWTYQASGTHIVLAFLVWIGLRALGVIPEQRSTRLRQAAQELLVFMAGLAGCSLVIFLWAQYHGNWARMLYCVKDMPRESMHLYLWRWSALLDNWTPDSLSLSGLKSYLASLDPHPLAAIVWLLLTVSWFRSRRRLAPVTCSRVGLLLVFCGVGLDLLYTIPTGSFLRGIYFTHYGICSYEGDFLRLSKLTTNTESAQAKVLAKPGGEVVGHALLVPDPHWHRDVFVLDLFVHPAFYPAASELLAPIELPPGQKVQAYADSQSPEKIQLLDGAGFHQEAVLRNQIINPEGQHLDAHILVTSN